MLNDADSCQAGGKVKGADALFSKWLDVLSRRQRIFQIIVPASSDGR
jgi:hypothetical protein